MIKTLSIPQWQEDFLRENPGLSPSKMLQMKITEIHNARKDFYPELKKKDNKIASMAEKLDDCYKDLEKLQHELDLEREKNK